jgi:hypothetical protein
MMFDKALEEKELENPGLMIIKDPLKGVTWP